MSKLIYWLTHTNLYYENFDEYQSLSLDSERGQRSLIPTIGQLMSTLFGTVSENNIDNINWNIKALASNQQQIIHDLDVSVSVLNLTRMQVNENRRSIMDLIRVIQKLGSKIRKLEQTFEQKFVWLKQFMHTYNSRWFLWNKTYHSRCCILSWKFKIWAQHVVNASFVNKTLFLLKILRNSWLKLNQSKTISNDQELIESDPTSCSQNQKGNNWT